MLARSFVLVLTDCPLLEAANPLKPTDSKAAEVRQGSLCCAVAFFRSMPLSLSAFHQKGSVRQGKWAAAMPFSRRLWLERCSERQLLPGD